MTRRWFNRAWLFLAAALVTAPMLAMVLAPAADGVSADELRVLAPAPAWPGTTEGWLKLPRVVDAFLDDHFGLRRALTRARSRIMLSWFNSSSSDQVLAGTDGRLFFRGDAMIQQSAGLLVRGQALAETADRVARIQRVLTARGIAFLFAPAPNASTIQPESLPSWARAGGRETEYDVMLRLLRERDVPALDLRPVLRAEAEKGSVFLTYDTHWNIRGMVAGFNAIVAQAGHADWRLDPSGVFASPAPVTGGDLARMLGIAADLKAPEPVPILSGRPVEDPSPGRFVVLRVAGQGQGTRLLIIGDSFTGGLFPQLAALRAGHVTWVHHQRCGFDWAWIEQARPDEIWWLPTERLMPCALPGPVNMP